MVKIISMINCCCVCLAMVLYYRKTIVFFLFLYATQAVCLRNENRRFLNSASDLLSKNLALLPNTTVSTLADSITFSKRQNVSVESRSAHAFTNPVLLFRENPARTEEVAKSGVTPTQNTLAVDTHNDFRRTTDDFGFSAAIQAAAKRVDRNVLSSLRSTKIMSTTESFLEISQPAPKTSNVTTDALKLKNAVSLDLSAPSCLAVLLGQNYIKKLEVNDTSKAKLLSRVDSPAHLAYLTIIDALKTSLTKTKIENRYRLQKVVLYGMDTFQDTAFEELSLAELNQLSICFCIPEKQLTTLQAMVLAGFDKVMDHKFTNMLWRGAVSQSPNISINNVLDYNGNNILHLAVLSESLRMLDKVLKLITLPYHKVEELQALLTSSNKQGLRPLDLVETLTPSVQHGMRAKLKKQFRLITAFQHFYGKQSKLSSKNLLATTVR